MKSSVGRTLVYSAVGASTEVVFSAIHDLKRGKEVRLRTSPWMLSVYALLTPLFEPLHNAIREKPAAQRAAIYGAGFLTVEYASGRAFRRWRGSAPWDYSYAKVHLHGLIRPDYFFLWAMAGLALEHLHDSLMEEQP